MKKGIKIGILVMLIILLAFGVGGKGDKLKGKKTIDKIGFNFNNLDINITICDYTKGKCDAHKGKDNLEIQLTKITEKSYNFSWTVDLPSDKYVSGLKVEYSSRLDKTLESQGKKDKKKKGKRKKSGGKSYNFMDDDVVTFDYSGLTDQGYDVEIEEEEDYILLKIDRNWKREGYKKGDNVLFHPYVAGSNQNSYNWTFRVDNTGPNISLISPSNGGSGSSTLTFNVSDLTVVSNCTLTLNGKSQEIDTSITESTDQTFTVGLGPGEHTWLVNCTDYLNNQANSTTWTFNNPKKKEEEEGGVVIGGDTSSKKTIEDGYKDYRFGVVNPDKPEKIIVGSDSLSIISLTLDVLNKVENVRFRVEEKDEVPLKISGITGMSVKQIEPRYITYKYFNIEKDNLDDDNINKIELEFRVDKNWLIGHGVTKDDVVLRHFDGVRWKEEKTEWTDSDVVNNYYLSEVNSLSLFAITINKERGIFREFIEKIGETVKGEEVKEKDSVEEKEEVKELDNYAVGAITLGIFGSVSLGVLVLVVIMIKRIFKKRKKK